MKKEVPHRYYNICTYQKGGVLSLSFMVAYIPIQTLLKHYLFSYPNNRKMLSCSNFCCCLGWVCLRSFYYVAYIGLNSQSWTQLLTDLKACTAMPCKMFVVIDGNTNLLGKYPRGKLPGLPTSFHPLLWIVSATSPNHS